MEAAKLITEIARELGSVAKEPLLYKKLYLLAALEMRSTRTGPCRSWTGRRRLSRPR